MLASTFSSLNVHLVWHVYAVQVRTRDFKPMLATRPGLAALVKARALQSLADHMQQ